MLPHPSFFEVRAWQADTVDEMVRGVVETAIRGHAEEVGQAMGVVAVVAEVEVDADG